MLINIFYLPKVLFKYPKNLSSKKKETFISQHLSKVLLKSILTYCISHIFIYTRMREGNRRNEEEGDSRKEERVKKKKEEERKFI